MAVVVFIKYPVSKKEEEILLISQYRPPVASEVRLYVQYDANRVDFVGWTSGFPCIHGTADVVAAAFDGVALVASLRASGKRVGR